MLFTHVYACGNRTVRGMEGVLASFRRCPAIRSSSATGPSNVATLARTLGAQGYSTVFLYGGRRHVRRPALVHAAQRLRALHRAEGFRSPRLHQPSGGFPTRICAARVTELDGLAAQKKPFLAPC